jgi:hypothetical protein
MNMTIEDLIKLDELKIAKIGNKNCHIHKDHRWVLPIIFEAQENKLLPRPCTIISFDYHHDSFDPKCLDEIKEIRRRGIRLDSIIALCRDSLAKEDNDWIKAGIELGLLKNGIIFGCHDCFDMRDKLIGFNDHRGNEHSIRLLGDIYSELLYQGQLSDISQHSYLKPIWDLLSWGPMRDYTFGFSPNDEPIFLDLDLDCFCVHWEDFKFPWPEEVYGERFFRNSNYDSTANWNGILFFDELLKRAGNISISREPDYCGGEIKAQKILEDVIRLLFHNNIK